MQPEEGLPKRLVIKGPTMPPPGFVAADVPLPLNLCVGDGGSDWEKRREKRSREEGGEPLPFRQQGGDGTRKARPMIRRPVGTNSSEMVDPSKRIRSDVDHRIEAQIAAIRQSAGPAVQAEPPSRRGGRGGRAATAAQAHRPICGTCAFFERRDMTTRGVQVASTEDVALLAAPFGEAVSLFHLRLVPQNHVASTLELEDEVYTQLRSFQKALVACWTDEGRVPIFVETVPKFHSLESTVMGAGVHCQIDVVGVKEGDLEFMKGCVKKALSEAKDDWATHTKLLEISGRRGAKGFIPKRFPFCHADFGLQGGYCITLEDEGFPRNFITEILADGGAEKPADERRYQEAIMEGRRRFEKFTFCTQQ